MAVRDGRPGGIFQEAATKRRSAPPAAAELLAASQPLNCCPPLPSPPSRQPPACAPAVGPVELLPAVLADSGLATVPHAEAARGPEADAFDLDWELQAAFDGWLLVEAAGGHQADGAQGRLDYDAAR
eukprot:15454936-Alexandrium_andersonii.AAC.1